MDHIQSKDDFTLISELGIGSFASVFKVIHIETGQEYAMKQMSKARIKQFHMEAAVLQEKQIMSQLFHPNIIQFYSSFQNDESLYFILELGCEDISVFKPENRFMDGAIQFMAAEILVAIEYLHQNLVLHRDLKPENIIIGRDGHIKLTDFGAAKRVNEEHVNPAIRNTTFVGSPMYVSPETLLSKPSTFQSDIWAFGCLLYFLHAGHAPFDGLTEFLLFQNIVEAKYSFEEEDVILFSDKAKDLIARILVVEPNDRLSLSDIKIHPYFDGIDWATFNVAPHPDVCAVRDTMLDKPKGRRLTYLNKKDHLLTDIPFLDSHDTPKPNQPGFPKQETAEQLQRRKERSNPRDPSFVHQMRIPFFNNPYTSTFFSAKRTRQASQPSQSTISSLPSFPLPFVVVEDLLQQLHPAPDRSKPRKPKDLPTSVPLHPSHYPSIQGKYVDHPPQQTSAPQKMRPSIVSGINLLGILSEGISRSISTTMTDTISCAGSYFLLTQEEIELSRRRSLKMAAEEEKLEKHSSQSTPSQALPLFNQHDAFEGFDEINQVRPNQNQSHHIPAPTRSNPFVIDSPQKTISDSRSQAQHTHLHIKPIPPEPIICSTTTDPSQPPTERPIPPPIFSSDTLPQTTSGD